MHLFVTIPNTQIWKKISLGVVSEPFVETCIFFASSVNPGNDLRLRRKQRGDAEGKRT